MWVTKFSKSRVHVLLTSYLALICLFSVIFFGLGALLFSVSILYLQLFVTLERLTSAALVPLEMKRCENSSSVRTHLCQFLYSQHICVYDLCIHCIAVPSFHLTRCASIHPCEDRIWVDVPFVPDSLVLNVGALLSRWTGNTWKASVHRPSEKTVDLMWPEGAKKILKKIGGNYHGNSFGVQFCKLKLFTLLHWGRDRIWHFFDETSRGSIRGRGSDSFYANVFNRCART